MKNLLRLCIAAFSFTATAAVSAQSPAFEVATIKLVDPNIMNMQNTMVFPGGRVQLASMSLKDLICIAFNVAYWQINDGRTTAEWMTKEHFDVEAKPPVADGDKQYDERHGFLGIKDERLRKMLQTLLEDRFQLKYHFASVEGPIYVLERSGKPLRLVPSRFDYSDGYSPIGVVAGRGVQINGMSAAEIANNLAQYVVHRKVVDQTELSGIYDFKSSAVVENSDIGASSKEAVLSAVKEMGLQLRSSKGPVERFVLEHVEMPSPN